MKKLISVFLLGALILCACKDPSVNKPIDKPSSTDSAQSAQNVSADDALYLATTSFDSMHPLGTHLAGCRDFFYCIYNPLFSYNENNELIPCLAESYSFANDALSMTLTLRKDVSWQDGTGFTARDVIHTLAYLRENDSVYSSLLQPMETAVIIDNHTIRFTFLEPCAFFPGRLIFPIIPQHVSDIEATPCGTGAYIYKEEIAHNKHLLAANPHYFLGEPKTKTVFFTEYATDETASYAFAAGELSSLRGSAVNFDTFAVKDTMELVTVPTNQYEFLAFNFNHPILSGENIRKAISLAIDRNAIVKDLLFEAGTPCNLPLGASTGIQETLTALPSDAAALLEKEGFTLEENATCRTSAVGALRFTLLYNANNKDRAQTASSIAAALSSVGIEITPIGAPYNEYIDRLTGGNYELILCGTSLSDGSDLSFLLGSGGSSNYFGYASAVMDMRLASIAAAVSVEAREAELSHFASFFTETQPICGLYFKRNIMLFQKDIVQKPMAGEILFRNIHLWQVNTES